MMNSLVKAALRSDVSRNDIERLMFEAAEAGDREEVRICQRALAGSRRATAYCKRRIREVRATFAACHELN